MGKRRKRLTMAKYATKYAGKRAAIEARRGVIEIDMNTGEEITEDETVQVITNKEPEPEVVEAATPAPEPQLQTQEVELSVDEIVAEIEEAFAEPPKKINALKATKKITTKKTTTAKKTTAKKATAKKAATRRKRATKKTTSAD